MEGGGGEGVEPVACLPLSNSIIIHPASNFEGGQFCLLFFSRKVRGNLRNNLLQTLLQLIHITKAWYKQEPGFSTQNLF